MRRVLLGFCAIAVLSPGYAAGLRLPSLPRTLAGADSYRPSSAAPAPPPAAPAAPAAVAPARAVAPAADGRVMLAYSAENGAVARYKNSGTITVDAKGVKMALDVKETDRTTIVRTDPSGVMVMEHETEASELSLNGHVMPANGGSQDKETVTIRPDGSLVSFTSSSSDRDTARTDARLFVATQPVFPGKPLAVGEKWSRDYSPDPGMGLRGAHADFQLTGLETLAGVATAKISMEYRELEGDGPISAKGVLWIERSSGDSVADQFELHNLPFPSGPPGAVANAQLKSERIAGGPIGGKPEDLVKTDPNRLRTVDELVKGYEKVPGLFTIYRKREIGRDTAYMEVREDQLEQLMLLEVTASTGTGSQVVAGDPMNDILFKLVRRGDDQLFMVTPNYKYTVHQNGPLERAIKRSFADGYLAAFKIEAAQPDRKSLLINVSDLFQGNMAEITDRLSAAGGGYAIDREKTFINSVKGFPENLVVQTAYHFTGRGAGELAALTGDTLADSRSMPLLVDYTIFALKPDGYRPRLADPRVGYFTNGMMWSVVQDFSDDSKRDSAVHYIYRWNIQKADPTAALSPPKQPIVFWLDNAIPVEYRPALREGILLWNRAFEKIGIRGAIVVKQMPDDADWDHADMRHNVVRWVLSPDSGYAVSLFRVNPITGEILNADITIDANMVRFDRLELQKIVDPATAFRDVFARQQTPNTSALDPRRCTLAAEATKQAWFGETALNLLAPAGVGVDHKAYVHDFLRSVVAHEMGHCLGLRHNFIASTQHSLEQLRNPALVQQHGLAASVMDYNPFNIAAIKHKGVPYWTPTIGDYDLWAIEYGYRTVKGSTPDEEAPSLNAIASRCNEPGHAYEGDEAADSWDPAITRFDLGNSSIAFWQRELDVSRELLLRLGDREPKKGQSYWEFTRDYLILLRNYAVAAAYASRSIGGLHVSNNFHGDPGEKPTLAPVAAAEQIQALGILRDYIFAEKALAFPRHDFTRLANNPYPGVIDFVFGPADYPVENMLSGIQRGALQQLFQPGVLTRVVNNEYKAGDSTRVLTLPAVFHTVSDAVWSELDSKKSISTLRRELQRVHLEILETMVLRPLPGTPPDASMLAWDQLRKLKTRIALAREHTYHDPYMSIHLDESLSHIDRILGARMMLGDGGGGGSGPRVMMMGAERSDLRPGAGISVEDIPSGG